MNMMEHVMPTSIKQTDANTVVLTINLMVYPHLQSPLVIESSMEEYLRRYPNADSWEAVAKNGLLTITVSGTINPHINKYK